MRTPPVRRRFLTLLAGAGILAAPACAQQSTLPAAGVRVEQTIVRASLPSQLLFLTNEDGSISIYPLSKPAKSGPLATISGLSGSQQEMTVDADGTLIVANNGAFAQDDYIAEYASPYDGPPTILNAMWQGALFYPIGVAVDSHGTVYASNCGKYCSETPGIFVYPSGATSPASVITSPNFDSMAGLATDSHGNLYAVAWNSTTFVTDVYEIAHGSTTPKALHLHGLSTGNGGNGVTLDAAGDVFVGSLNSGSNYILAFRPGARTAYKVIDSMPFGSSPEMLTFGPDGNLYVPTFCAFAPCAQMYGFHPHAAKAFESIGPSQNETYSAGVATAPNPQLEGK
jgi:hypothetical protein